MGNPQHFCSWFCILSIKNQVFDLNVCRKAILFLDIVTEWRNILRDVLKPINMIYYVSTDDGGMWKANIYLAFLSILHYVLGILEILLYLWTPDVTIQLWIDKVIIWSSDRLDAQNKCLNSYIMNILW